MYFYLSYPFIGFFVLIHITELVFFCSTSAIGTTIQLVEFFKTSNSSTEVNGLHSASLFELNVIGALQVKTIEFNQSIHITQCDVFLWGNP